MNWQFYDFWGNYLIQVARGQKQAEEMATWMQQGFNGLSDMADLFRKCYGLPEQDADEERTGPSWQQAISDFQEAFVRFAAQWGWVSAAEHQKILDQCAALEKKVDEQQVTIDQLRDLLTQKGMGSAELFTHLQNSLNEQSKQFHELMRRISNTGESRS